MKQLFRVIRTTRELWPLYAGISVFTILLALLSQLQPLFVKAAIDQSSKLIGGGHANVQLVGLFAVLIFATDFGVTIISNISGYIGDIMSVRLQKIMGERYYQHVLNLSQSYFDTELSGKIINRMNRGIGQISQFMQILSNNFLQFLFTTIFALGIVFYFSWQVGLMLAALYPAYLFLTTRTSERWQMYQKQINEKSDVASGRFAEAVGQVKVVKSFLQHTRELRFWQQQNLGIIELTRPQSLLWHRQDVVRRVFVNVLSLGVYAFIFVETARGHYSVGTMVLLIQYTQLIRIPLFTISYLVDATQRAISNTKDYFEVLDTVPQVADRAGAKRLVVRNGEIQFADVQFAYDLGKPVLQGVSFTVPAGSNVALVGESGEGKTTITNLLLRLYDVTDGMITIDGQNIADVTQASLRRNIGIVFQDPALFSGTIRENIAYANPSAKEVDVLAAAHAANAHDFIMKFEKGYDTEIGERGLKLSGGQKQRIAIARAFFKDAPILILDEATSSLDSKSEQQVQHALQRLMNGRTTLIIAHRLSTIQAVDTIVTLRSGSVDEIGTPAELRATTGIYAQLLQLQERGTESSKKKLQTYEIAE